MEDMSVRSSIARPCECSHVLRRRIRSVGLLGESEGKERERARTSEWNREDSGDKGWSEQSRRLKVKDEDEREKKKHLKCFKWMVPREKQLCISAMLVVLNALTSILYTTVKKKHVHCKKWFIDQVNNALNNNEKITNGMLFTNGMFFFQFTSNN